MGAAKRALRARLPPILTLCSLKIDVFLRVFSSEPRNLQPQNRCISCETSVQFSAHRTKRHACHGIRTLSPLDASLPMRFAKNTQLDTSKVLRLRRKMTMDTSKVFCLPRKLQRIFRKRRKSIAPATQNDLSTSECHEVLRLPRETKQRARRLKPRKTTPSADHRHRPYSNQADGCGRLRTVADVNGTSSEHSLNPQTPRVKREPLLRIREKTHVPLFIVAHDWNCIANPGLRKIKYPSPPFYWVISSVGSEIHP